MSLARTLRSSSFRVALLSMGLMGASMVALLGFIDWSTTGYMERQLDQTIEAEVEGLAGQYRSGGLVGLSAAISRRVTDAGPEAGVYLLAGADLAPLVGNLDRWPAAVPDGGGWVHFSLRAEPKGQTHRTRGKTFLLTGDLHLLVGRDLRDLDATRALVRSALAWGLALTAALALLGGWLTSAGVRRRIEAITRASRDIMAGDLSRRVPSDGSGDDFDQLALSLNAMLARIEALMASLRQVTDNIAHDLRTPLARLRNRLDALRLATAPSPDLEAAILEADELLATFNALLRIARIESAQARAGFARLDLVPLAEDLAELYEPLAGERGQTLKVAVQGPAWVHGDRDLLFQALANLVDNAVKYTPPGGCIELRVVPASGAVLVTVSDSGPGIPPDLQARVFERFFRADASRSAPGSGLGLSLVQAVAQLHGATIRLANTGSGLQVTLSIPLGGPAA